MALNVCARCEMGVHEECDGTTFIEANQWDDRAPHIYEVSCDCEEDGSPHDNVERGID